MTGIRTRCLHPHKMNVFPLDDTAHLPHNLCVYLSMVSMPLDQIVSVHKLWLNVTCLGAMGHQHHFDHQPQCNLISLVVVHVLFPTLLRAPFTCLFPGGKMLPEKRDRKDEDAVHQASASYRARPWPPHLRQHMLQSGPYFIWDLNAFIFIITGGLFQRQVV